MLDALLAHPGGLILLLAACSERYLPMHADYRPLSGYQRLAAKVAAKVNRPQHSLGQRRLAGVLATLLLLPPALLLIGLFRWGFNLPLLTDTLLLFWLLDSRGLERLRTTAAKLPRYQGLKLSLRPWSLRELTTLSREGIAKASIESATLRFCYHWFAVVFWYLLGGIWGACGYRLLSVLAQSWNGKLADFQPFSEPVTRASVLLQRPPAWLMAQLLRLYRRHATPAAEPPAQQWPCAQTGRLLQVMAEELQCNLGGPRYYGTELVRYPRLGPAPQPDSSHLEQARQRLGQLFWLWLLATSGILLVAA